MLHTVVDGQAGDDASAGGVDVEVDGFVGVFGVEVEHDANDLVGEFVVDFGAEEDDAFAVEAVVDVDPVGALGAGDAVGYFGDSNLRDGKCVFV